MRHRLFISTLLLLACASYGLATDALFRLPGGIASEADGAFEIRYQQQSLNYVPGLGWLENLRAPAPVVQAGEVYVGSAVLEYLGIDGLRLEGVRWSDSGTLRLVLDLGGLRDPSRLAPATGEGQLSTSRTLHLHLPPMLLPQNWPQLESQLSQLGFQLESTDAVTTLSLRGPSVEREYEIFHLSDPDRLVIDITPTGGRDARWPQVVTPAPTPTPTPAPTPAPGAFVQPSETEARSLLPGVTHRRYQAPTASGSSQVNVLEFEPQAGHFRVVGESRTARPLSELASGAFAAINAGYFHTGTFDTIGLLQVDHAILSLPSRNRASIGFGPSGTVIDRTSADVQVRINGQLSVSERLGNSVDAGRIDIHTTAGARVGDTSKGVIVVTGNRVIENRIGPRTVPPNGFAIVYQADIRELALVDPGDQLSYDVNLVPSSFNTARYAVEAGPLLVHNGQPAYDPSYEAFQVGTRIVDSRVQQAAVAVRPDGTVLFVAAEAMTASELVPLFLALGAEHAMRLDSGTSTTLFAAGSVLNRVTTERRIVSAIVFIPSTWSARP